MSILLPLIAAGVGMASGARKAAIERDNQRRTTQLRAEQIRSSPWTNRQNFEQIQYASTDPFSAMASGAIGGAMTGVTLGKSLKGMGFGQEAIDAAQAAAPDAAKQMASGMQNSTSMYAKDALFAPQAIASQKPTELQQLFGVTPDPLMTRGGKPSLYAFLGGGQ